jgi:hypothetical protein
MTDREMLKRLKVMYDLARDMCGGYGEDTDSMRRHVRATYLELRRRLLSRITPQTGGSAKCN